MNLYGIADLHLSLGVEKPMDIFGGEWEGYAHKIESNWINNISDDDYIVIPGDVSWGMTLDEALPDFELLQCLPGTKIIIKGNHDYWWQSSKKLDEFKQKYSLHKIVFLHNNSFKVPGTSVGIFGSRGWKCPGDIDFSAQDRKVYNRELIRLEASLLSDTSVEERLVFMHYPPFNTKLEKSGFVEILEKYDIKYCYYGHLHGIGHRLAMNGILPGANISSPQYVLISSDYIRFMPFLIKKDL